MSVRSPPRTPRNSWLFPPVERPVRYQRFFTAAPTLRAHEAAYLTQIDHHNHEALVAIGPATGDIVGVARFIRSCTDPASAEIAVTVADWWQGRGLGSKLLHHLVERAREEKITRFTADILTGNRAMLALIRQVGVVDTTVERCDHDRHGHQ